MELTLTYLNEIEVSVTCDGQLSHTFTQFSLSTLEHISPDQPPADPVAYGTQLFALLFPPETVARRNLDLQPERIVVITGDDMLASLPWEYLYGPDGWLVLTSHFVRGLPVEQRIALPTLPNTLRIIAVPSQPLSYELRPLHIEGEWIRLKEIVNSLPGAVALERTRPATIEQVRTLLVGQQGQIVHFMGHGGQNEQGAFLCFEQENGALTRISAQTFVRRMRGTVFLVTMNACQSAASGDTHFSNLAAALVRQKIPYALGMRFTIHDEDARAFSRTFYSDLARGSSVEEALLQARLTLAESPRPWAVGLPVLYTSLATPAPGYTLSSGTPVIREHQPRIEAMSLPRAEGAFQGRIDELKQLGTWLTGDVRQRIITLHGFGGQGKTTLAREAVERFAWAWPGGVWASSLENLPSCDIFVTSLAHFLNIPTQEIAEIQEIERRVLASLHAPDHHRTLIVLDNAESIVHAIQEQNKEAFHLVAFLQQLPSSTVSLLITSREHLGWPGEETVELDGLLPGEGAALFRQCAPQRQDKIELRTAWKLSERLDGHPLSLRLLGSAFNANQKTLQEFLQELDEQLLLAENIYKETDHRHHSLNACIDISVRYLDEPLRELLSGLWIFHAAFTEELACTVLYPQTTDAHHTLIHDRLYQLWQRSLLIQHSEEYNLSFYRLPSTTRPYIEHYLKQVFSRVALLSAFGEAYAQLALALHDGLDNNPVATILAQQQQQDFERGSTYVSEAVRCRYQRHWGWVQYRLGNAVYGLKLLEQALELAQETEWKTEEAAILNSQAIIYRQMGLLQDALLTFDRVLAIQHQDNDVAGEATTLHNKAMVYYYLGQLHQAAHIFQQAQSLFHTTQDERGEATVLAHMAMIYRKLGEPDKALVFLKHASRLQRKIKDIQGEAATLNNIALLMSDASEFQSALKTFRRVLSLQRKVGDQQGEATTLNNIATVFCDIGQAQQALALLEEALLLRRSCHDLSGEADTLNNIATLYYDLHQPREAIRILEQARSLQKDAGNQLAEISIVVNIAIIYIQKLGQGEQGTPLLESALAYLTQENLPQDASGHTVEQLQTLLHQTQKGR